MNELGKPRTAVESVNTAAATRARWQIVALLVCFSFMTWFNRVSMSVAYDEQIKAESGISPEHMGYVYSAFLFAYMVCMTPGGWLIDRYGAWAALAVMGVGSALFGALTGAAGHPAMVAAGLLWPGLLVIRSLMGMFSAPVYPASSRIVSYWMPVSQRALANGLVQGAAAVGIACTFPVFGSLIDWLDWRNSFLISASVTFLVALGWAVFGANYPRQHRQIRAAPERPIETDELDPPRPQTVPAGEETGITAVPRSRPMLVPDLDEPRWWMLLGHRSLMLLTLCYACVGYVEYLFFFWMHHYFEDILHLGKSESRAYAAVLTLAMAAGMIVGGWAQDRLRAIYGRKSSAVVPVVGLCAGAALLLLGVRASETVWIVTLLALALAAVGATEAPVWTMAVELGGRHGGTAAGICNTGGNAGGLMAPIVTPYASGWITRYFGVDDQAGWQWGISLGSIVAICGAVLWWWITPGDGHRQSQ
jgi:MFS family permease